ncbi:RNA polymerase sigma-70 factor (ECF subfamily) [Mucilaginibacter gracilis]|uniref:RNA polymerase sigma-70 factor (ECF subfamily) n=1 Tax=Mucilaginibacter gracilis TaxID=423350 RepID=A0A495J3K6_9SPHI|nr:sigma-70 family RNA polymerase sigma factor [Mucilaginibacter gracilis]RKR83527.1 RNA polymerase sigma-70 factor (ECF subfamily) [Mucilaginibacter gracilis]
MTEQEFHQLIIDCKKHDRKGQKLLYKAFYGFAMGICLRYAGNRDEAADVMNQGFFKVFTNIDKYDTERPFKAWLGRIMMNTSIDYYRSNLKMAYAEDLDKAEHLTDGELPDRKLNYDDLLNMIQRLPQAYRTVFNLFAVEGYTHDEIGVMLNINAGTSKSNLHKARQKLKQMILDADAQGNNATNYKGLNYSSVVAINTTQIREFFNRSIR